MPGEGIELLSGCGGSGCGHETDRDLGPCMSWGMACWMSSLALDIGVLLTAVLFNRAE